MRIAVGLLLAGLFVAALIASTLRETRATCEVCVDFGGQSQCRSASAADREQALAMAQSTACAVLSAGVTAGLQCQRTPPRSLRCDGD